MLIIDYPHDDPKLKSGFTIRTTLIATIYTQRLADGPPPTRVLPLRDSDRQGYLAPTEALDFNEPSAKVWISQHDLWKKNGEDALAFARRVQRTLRTQLPYSVADGGRWNCSQIMKVGFGECARHAIVGTSILRANNIPARAVCTLWAVDESSKGAHCWGEFFLEGVGWVPYDSSFDQPNPNADSFFARRDADFIAGMVDMDWLIDAGSLGKHSVFAIDAWPAFWAEGEGDFDGLKCQTSTTVRVLQRFR
jgi:transglutaminase-like putative cysteine protease